MADALANPHGLASGADPERRNESYTGGEVARNLTEGGLGRSFGPIQRVGGLAVYRGVVNQSIPFARTYNVRVAGEMDYACVHGLGAHNNVDCLPVGTAVVIAVYPGGNRGVILAVDHQRSMGGAASELPGAVLLGDGPMGVSSPMYSAYLNQPDLGGVLPVSGTVPMDNLSGDAGCLNALDVGWVIGLTSILWRAGDLASVEAHALDGLLRLHGHNYERYAVGYERRQFDDEGELHDVEYESKFPWEGDGLLGPGGAFREEIRPNWDSTAAAVEPAAYNQTGAWRVQSLRGYLGDVFRRQVLRQSDVRAEEPAVYGQSPEEILRKRAQPVALSEIHCAADGALHLRSAKEIVLQKRALIPAALQLNLPDDHGSGDWRENYRASGVWGEGPAPAPQTEYPAPADYPGNCPLAAIQEHLAHTFNWTRPANLLNHGRDWLYPEEGAPSAGYGPARSWIAPEAIQALSESYWAGPPAGRAVGLDGRLPGVAYHEALVTVAMTGDGGLVLEDGWGSSIQMYRGNIVLSCPGDVIMNPGRRLVVQAGLDAVIRARNSVDVTTTRGDVRIRADRNFQLLAGNDREDRSGGVLIESRARTTEQDYSQAGEKARMSGITLLARESRLALIGQDAYLGASGEGTRDRQAPAVVIDAAPAGADIYLEGERVLRKAREFADKYGDRDRYAYAGAGFWFTQSDTVAVEGDLSVARGDSGSGGQVRAEGALYALGDVLAEGRLIGGSDLLVLGTAYAGRGVAYNGETATMVAPAKNSRMDIDQAIRDGIGRVVDGFARLRDNGDRYLADAGKWTTAAGNLVRGDNHPGGDRLRKEAAFSLRTDEDYRAGGFCLSEALWQATPGLDLEAWKERPVRNSTGGDTYPFPGRKAYEEPGSLRGLEPRLFSLKEGVAVKRGDVYQERARDPEKLTLSDYKVFKFKE
jgi:hypothetical protein